MKCQYCKSDETAVIDTRVSEYGTSIRRRRECESCDKRFTTYERVELARRASCGCRRTEAAASSPRDCR